MDQRDHQALAAERDALVGFAGQQVLVGRGQLMGEREAGLRRFQRVTGERMRRAGVQPFELRPQRDRRVPVDLGEFETPRVTHRDAIGRRERIADDPRRLDRLLPGRVRQPFDDAGGSRFRRIHRLRGQRRQVQSEGGTHGGGRAGRTRLYATSSGMHRTWPASDPQARGVPRAAGVGPDVSPSVRRKSTTALTWSAGQSVGAWPTPANSTSRGRGPRCVIARAVDAERRSDSAPRSTSVGQSIASHSGHRSAPDAALRNGTAMPGS